MTRRAFTILELVTALAMSSIVALAAFGLVGMLGKADNVTSDAVDNAVQSATTRTAVSRALQRLVAATPITEEVDPDERATSEDESDTTANASSARDIAPGLSADLPLEVAVADTSAPPYFDLHFVPSPAGPVPRLEIVCETPPIGRHQSTLPTADERLSLLRAEWLGSVRGAFELAPMAGGWSLVWAPIDPPGEPVELMGNLTHCAWEVLLRDDQGWRPVHAAYLQPDFPIAVRLQIASASGAEADWLFETAIITEGR